MGFVVGLVGGAIILLWIIEARLTRMLDILKEMQQFLHSFLHYSVVSKYAVVKFEAKQEDVPRGK